MNVIYIKKYNTQLYLPMAEYYFTIFFNDFLLTLFLRVGCKLV